MDQTPTEIMLKEELALAQAEIVRLRAKLEPYENRSTLPAPPPETDPE